MRYNKSVIYVIRYIKLIYVKNIGGNAMLRHYIGTIIKYAIAILGIFIFCALFVECIFSNDCTASQETIIKYIKENHEKLKEFPINDMPPKDENIEGNYTKRKHFIQKNLGNQTVVKDVYGTKENTLYFDCGGTGMLDNCTYTDFYYSPSDTADFNFICFPTNDNEPKEISPGVYEKAEISENLKLYKLTVIRVMPNWFYRHAISGAKVPPNYTLKNNQSI